MTSLIKGVTNQGTTGKVTASVHNPQVNPPAHLHIGDADKMVMVVTGGVFKILTTEKLGSGANQQVGLDFELPEQNLPAVGGTRQYIVGQEITTRWWAYENAGGKAYRGTSGMVHLTRIADEHFVGDFDFVGTFGSQSVQVTKGDLDLTGFITPTSVRSNAPTAGSGTFTGSFTGGPVPGPFSATQVSIQEYSGGGIPKYLEIQGRRVEGFPEVQTFIAINLKENATGLTFDLATSTDVSVTFFTFPDYGFAFPVYGTLTFNVPPDAKQAAGTLNCVFQKNDDPTFTYADSFAITA